MDSKSTNSNKVLISSFTGVGNMILKTPFIRSIYETIPDVQLHLIVGYKDKAEFIFSEDGFIQQRIELNKTKGIINKFRFCLRIRKEEYGYIFFPFDDEIPISIKLLLSILSRAMIVTHYTLPRIQTPRALLIFLFYLINPKVKLVPFLPGRHEIDLNYDLLQSFNDSYIERTYETFLEYKCDKENLKRFSLTENEYIVFQLSAKSGSPTPKKWPLKNFIELYKKIRTEYPEIKIVTIGNTADYEAEVSEFLKYCPDTINTAGKTSIEEVTSILLYAAVSIVHDSGAMHLANAVSSKVIALYGPTDITRTGPLDDNTKVLISQNESTHIMFNSLIGEEGVLKIYGDEFCMSDLESTTVFNEIRKFLT